MIIYWQKRCTRFCRGWTGCSLAAVARAIMSAGAGGLFPAPPAPPPLHLAQHLAAGQASILIIIIIILRPDISTFAFANYEVISGIKIITKGDHTREHEETMFPQWKHISHIIKKRMYFGTKYKNNYYL